MLRLYPVYRSNEPIEKDTLNENRELVGERLELTKGPLYWLGPNLTLRDCTVFEVKNGPYAPANDKAFAAWAPA